MGYNDLNCGSSARPGKSSPEMQGRALPQKGMGAPMFALPERSRKCDEPSGLEEGDKNSSLGCLWDLKCGEAVSSGGCGQWLRGGPPGAGKPLASATVHHGGSSSSSKKQHVLVIISISAMLQGTSECLPLF